ncbi:MAG: GNAT family N-acetyltransferase [Bryobacterales bacterium]
MAASPVQPQDFLIVDLRDLRGSDLDSLLAEQTAFWKQRFLWDFSASADVIRRFLDMRNLFGFALLREGTPIGYSYFVHEDRKALVGDLFITAAHRSEPAERALLHNTIKSAVVFPNVRRVEGQLLGLSFNPHDEVVYGRGLSVFERNFMVLEDLRGFPIPRKPARGVSFQTWSDRQLDGAAELVALSYRNHVDSLINDQYRTFAGARRFLFNTTQHPGCGVFCRPAALIAVDEAVARLAGICLGSLVHPEIGHITQIAVGPGLQGRGIGFELLRRSVAAFHAQRCRAVSLTVTAANHSAVNLYEHVGFRTFRQFYAFVWEAS